RALDDELLAMHRVMCSVRARRNTLSSISRLPVEILARIFLFHAYAEPAGTVEEVSSKDGDLQLPSVPRLGWISVTMVCRNWRQIAFNYPNLWTNVAFTLGDRWTEEMISRAKSAPL
ncbi:hypothetical protein BV25DRAFT_1783860, partial [Artomyces pyxidatus]